MWKQRNSSRFFFQENVTLGSPCKNTVKEKKIDRKMKTLVTIKWSVVDDDFNYASLGLQRLHRFFWFDTSMRAVFWHIFRTLFSLSLSSNPLFHLLYNLQKDKREKKWRSLYRSLPSIYFVFLIFTRSCFHVSMMMVAVVFVV